MEIDNMFIYFLISLIIMLAIGWLAREAIFFKKILHRVDIPAYKRITIGRGEDYYHFWAKDKNKWYAFTREALIVAEQRARKLLNRGIRP